MQQCVGVRVPSLAPATDYSVSLPLTSSSRSLLWHFVTSCHSPDTFVYSKTNLGLCWISETKFSSFNDHINKNITKKMRRSTRNFGIGWPMQLKIQQESRRLHLFSETAHRWPERWCSFRPLESSSVSILFKSTAHPSPSFCNETIVILGPRLLCT